MAFLSIHFSLHLSRSEKLWFFSNDFLKAGRKVTMDDPSSRTHRTDPRKHYFHFTTDCPHAIESTLEIAGNSLDVTVPEQTHCGFTAVGSAKVAESLRLGVRWVLKLEGKRFEVFPQWIHCAADGRVQIGLRRMRQLAPDTDSGFVQRSRDHFRLEGHWALAIAVIVMILSAACLMRQL